MLGNLLDLQGFDFASSEEVREIAGESLEALSS